MFDAIRLPAARRLAGAILRATTTGWANFIAILASSVLKTVKFTPDCAGRP
ncbi:MAG: hypothetical protein ACREQZ_03395 [Woeseiaceae bacterium]